MSSTKKILLHTCCAPCASACCERLMDDDFAVTLFFSNCNIYSSEEYEKRLDSVHHLAKKLSLPVVVDEYDHALWLNCIKGYEAEPEHGTRCLECFAFSLRRTAHKADYLEIPMFTTSLTVSPHKHSSDIFNVAKQYENFRPYNFKKQSGFQRSLELSKQYSLYRQSFCGCEFSLRE